MPRWVIGLPAGREVWVQADSVSVDHGCLVITTRSADTGAPVVRTLARGEWTSLTLETGAVDEQLAAGLDRFCVTMDAGAPPSRPALRAIDRRHRERRRRSDLSEDPATWTGMERRSGTDRRMP
jgi:hypothetical protein